jgi:TolB-like protein
MTTPPDIFLSYNREDQTRAKLFAEAFEAQGFKVWWDVGLRTGEAYDEVTETALRTAKAVVVLWSKKSVQSRWVRAEATLADRNKTLVPCMIEPCERPIMFELTQTAELAHWSGETDDGVWIAFLDDVRRFVGRDAAAPIVLLTAPEPQPPKSGERGEAPSLAVLPFTNRSGLTEDDVFAIGMVEDLIDALSLRVFFRVLSSGTTARYANGALPDLEAMGRQLGVRYLLEGNVRRVGSNLRVTAQLVEAAQGDILWTQKFDRPLAELAALQEELIFEVATLLGVQVYRRELARTLQKPNDLTAWELVARAVSAFRQMTPASMAEARTAAQQAVSIAPDYGAAHAMLAFAEALTFFWTGGGDAADRQRISNHVETALALDSENAAVVAYAGAALAFIGRPLEGLRHSEKAIRLSPYFGFAHYTCGNACELLGRTDEALAHYENFQRVEPQSPHEYMVWYRTGRTHLRKQDWPAADSAFIRSLSLNSRSGLILVESAVVAQRFGRTTEALAKLAEARNLDASTLQEWQETLKRAHAGSPALEEVQSHLRALWAATEDSA